MSEKRAAQVTGLGSFEDCHEGMGSVPAADAPPVSGSIEKLLAPRERQVAELAATGLDSSTIAERLAIKPSTVRTTLHRVYGKLSIRGRDELRDIVSPPPQGETEGASACCSGSTVDGNDDRNMSDSPTVACQPSDATSMPLLIASVGLLCFVPATAALQPSLLAYAFPTSDAYGVCGIGVGAGILVYLLHAFTRRRIDISRLHEFGLSLLMVAFVLSIQLACMQSGILVRFDRMFDVVACLSAAAFAALLCSGLAALFNTSKTLLDRAGVLSARFRMEAATAVVLLVVAAIALDLVQVAMSACGIGVVVCGIVLYWQARACAHLERSIFGEPDEHPDRPLPSSVRFDSTLLGFQALPCCLAFLVIYLFGLAGGLSQVLVWAPFVVFSAAGFHSFKGRLGLRLHEVISCALLLALGLMMPGTYTLAVCAAAALMGMYLYRNTVHLLIDDRQLPDSTVILWYMPLSVGCLLGGIASIAVADMLAFQRAGDVVLASAMQPLYELCLFAAASVCAVSGLLFWRSCCAARDDRVVGAGFRNTSSDGAVDRFQSYLRYKGLDETCCRVVVATVRGKSVRQIAEELSYAPSTIKAFRRRAFRILNVDDAMGLARLYRQVIDA